MRPHAPRRPAYCIAQLQGSGRRQAHGVGIVQDGTRRLLVEDTASQAAAGGTAGAGGKLSVQCQALVSLAEPGNLYKAFQDSFTATGVATQAKYLEQKLNLPVRPYLSKSALPTSRNLSAHCFADAQLLRAGLWRQCTGKCQQIGVISWKPPAGIVPGCLAVP